MNSLCSLEAALEGLMQIELAEDLETEKSMPTTERLYPCLEASEMNHLLRRLGQYRGPAGCSTDEAETLLDWANAVRWEEKTLRQLLAGEIGVDVTEDGLLFIAPEKS